VYKPDNSGVDDLWHAAINGRGRFVNAGSADELKLGMGQILQDITNQGGSRASAGLASSSISLTNHSVYKVTFQPGWAGTVTKIDIDVVTGAELSNIWEAAQQLHNQLAITTPDPTCVVPGSCPWFTNRKIFTTDDSNTAVPFLWANLSAAQQDSLAPGLPAVGQAVVEYLRGNPTNEGVAIGQFRVRATASFGENFLGDIVDSQAVYVGPPNYPYVDTNDPGYSTFVAANNARPARVYAGANDGMVHAFDDTNGNETWAYIPHDLYRADATGLGALVYQDGALPPFRHHYYVDSTPRVYDVNFGGGDSDWHTLLVGGLGKGGSSYYALDVTDPGSITTEAQAASRYLWTFTDTDMGYSFGRAMLAKTRAFGGAWVMVVASGYNSPSGVGKIFFVNAKTGAKLKEMSTGFGTSANPSGLAQVSGYTRDFRNQLIDQIYGGDLYGNFWRFDVTDTDPANWTVTKIAYLTDPGGNPQPVTTPPEIKVDLANGVDRWVFIGTGRLLDESDLTDTTIADQQQTFYAIRDGDTNTPLTFGAPLQPRTDFDALTDKVNGLASKPAKGWYDDLPPGERIITAVKAAISVVAYAGTSPQDNPCLTGQPATLYVREYSLGESLLTDAGGIAVSGVAETQGAVGLDITIFSDSSGTDSSSGIDIRVLVGPANLAADLFQHVKPPSFISAHRMSWRMLGQ
jgi:type IV pilus assembly protein PilY1